jgi:hypothetical protein
MEEKQIVGSHQRGHPTCLAAAQAAVLSSARFLVSCDGSFLRESDDESVYRCSSFLGKKKQKNMAWGGKSSKTCRKPSKTRVERWKKKLCQHREDLLDSRLKEETAPLVIDVYCWVPTARRY